MELKCYRDFIYIQVDEVWEEDYLRNFDGGKATLDLQDVSGLINGLRIEKPEISPKAKI